MLFGQEPARSFAWSKRRVVKYSLRQGFAINVGFVVNSKQILEAINLTNLVLSDLPASLYRSIDYKTTSSIVGSVFGDSLASKTDAIVNPIEKGHPDLVPPEAANSTEAQLRNYPRGLEIKTTVGNIVQGANLRAGQVRVGKLIGVTWQAHHREVKELLARISHQD